MEILLEEAETLIWALLDDTLGDAEATRLSELMESNAAIRTRYVDCVQLHIDLQQHYSKPGSVGVKKPAGSMVMPNLMLGGLPGAASYIPTTD